MAAGVLLVQGVQEQGLLSRPAARSVKTRVPAVLRLPLLGLLSLSARSGHLGCLPWRADEPEAPVAMRALHSTRPAAASTAVDSPGCRGPPTAGPPGSGGTPLLCKASALQHGPTMITGDEIKC